mmetsp:Transcript_26125/g.53662  ORF Transcript_26125/g.53662 Transcript_26125/m.53662 type:complete len:429 (-) Transcript_26125:107-1393(-)
MSEKNDQNKFQQSKQEAPMEEHQPQSQQESQPQQESRHKQNGNNHANHNSQDVVPLHPSNPRIRFDQLPNYPPSSLRATSFYDPQTDPQIKPITLTVMGYGTPNFPDISLDNPTIKRAVSRTNSQMYNLTDILPNTKFSKSYLRKEVWRRVLTRGWDRKDFPRVKNWINSKLIEFLEEHPPLEEEQEDIVGMVNSLLANMHRYYLTTRPAFMNHREGVEIERHLSNNDDHGGDERVDVGGNGHAKSCNTSSSKISIDELPICKRKRRVGGDQYNSWKSSFDRPTRFGLVVIPTSLDCENNDNSCEGTETSSPSLFDQDGVMVVTAHTKHGEWMLRIVIPFPRCIMNYNANQNMIGAATCIDGYIRRKRCEVAKIALCKFIEDGSTLNQAPVSEWYLKDFPYCGVDERADTARLLSIERTLRVLLMDSS